jgi:hypothetical protein
MRQAASLSVAIPLRRKSVRVNNPLIRKFELYHAKYPNVYLLFSDLTRQTIRRGKKVSAQFIIERIRWEIIMGAKDEDGFKINANFAAFYARMFMKDFPGYAGYFHLRTSVADEWVITY